MSVGGNIIEMTPVTLESGTEAIRLRVMDPTYGDETHVHAAPWAEGQGPSMGETVWWQEGKIYFNRDRCWVRKIGNSGCVSDRFSFRFIKACAAWIVLKAWPNPLPLWMFWILPSAGDYAYWDEPAFIEQRQRERITHQSGKADQ